MKTVWFMLAFFAASAPEGEPMYSKTVAAVQKPYRSEKACLADIPNQLTDKSQLHKAGVICARGVVVP